MLPDHTGVGHLCSGRMYGNQQTMEQGLGMDQPSKLPEQYYKWKKRRILGVMVLVIPFCATLFTLNFTGHIAGGSLALIIGLAILGAGILISAVHEKRQVGIGAEENW